MIRNIFQAKMNLLILERGDLCMYSYVEYNGLSLCASPHTMISTEDSKVKYLQEK